MRIFKLLLVHNRVVFWRVLFREKLEVIKLFLAGGESDDLEFAVRFLYGILLGQLVHAVIGADRWLDELKSNLIVNFLLAVIYHLSLAGVPRGKMNLILHFIHNCIILVDGLDRISKLVLQDTFSVFGVGFLPWQAHTLKNIINLVDILGNKECNTRLFYLNGVLRDAF